MSKPVKEFGKLRSMFWPVHAFELKKILPMFLMFFLISFNYTILRDTKDTLIVTGSGSGAEAIPFLKFWGVMPMAIIFMIVYAKLSNKLSKTKLFYATIIPFIVFFALFATVLYPARDFLHPNAFCDNLQQILPQGMMGFIAIIRNWTFSLFYVLSELWGSVALSLLFWGFANDIMKISEAKRFYALLGIGANVALLISGPSIIMASNIRAKIPAGVDAWGVSLNYLMSMVVVAGILIVGIYWWMNKYVLTDSKFSTQADEKIKKKNKPKLSIKDSFQFLAKSKYLRLLCILVVSYGIGINIIEVVWKKHLGMQFPNPNEYSVFMGGFSIITGIVTTLMMLFVGGNVIRKFGWAKAAQVTPIVLLVTGFAFFTLVLFKGKLTPMLALVGTTPLMLAVVAGAIQNIMSKSSKYSLFDPTKEMAYIPLDPESKVKGKAAIDVVGARLGKSGGSLLQQGLILACGSIIAIVPYVAGILAVIVIFWLMSAKSLGKLFVEKSEEQNATKEATDAVKEVVTKGSLKKPVLETTSK